MNFITDASKDKYPFTLKGDTTINDGEPEEINRVKKGFNQLTRTIEKMFDKNDERLEVLFPGGMLEYTFF